MVQPIPGTSPVLAHHLPDLCRLDEDYIRANMSTPPAPGSYSSKVRVALIPDAETLHWHHAREEFVAKELFHRSPDVKGAMVAGEGEGGRVWCIWTRTYGSELEGNTLNVLRLVIEGEEHPTRQAADGSQLERSSSDDDAGETLDPLTLQKIHATSLVLLAAQHEAAKWGMRDVQLWNPTRLCVLAARRIKPGIKVVHRDEESIASLRWHGDELGDGAEVEWVGNEKFGWC